MSEADPSALPAAGQAARVETFDVLIVGAGISGIDAAYHVQRRLPGKSFAILEARERIGGTWDLFRFPGIRSDSDMYTLGFPFRPWRGDEAIVGGGAIRDYVEETAREFGIDRAIRFRNRVRAARWSSADALWTLDVDTPDGPARMACRFLLLCSGYYDYAAGYRPTWPGEEAFAGTFVHPQHWPESLDYRGKRVVVIGSGATAVTLVPAMARDAAKVAMLQRSPSYIVARPGRDRIARFLSRWLGARSGAALTRLKNVLLGQFFFARSRSKPEKVRRTLLKLVEKELGPGFDIARDFSPRYNPWDQRVCLVPDGDLFTAMKAGRAEVVTDTIDRFTPRGVLLSSGRELEADIVVTATGLVVKLLGGMTLEVDGVPVDPAERFVFKGMMLSDVPNLALSFGYTNASWTLKCDLTARYVCRLVRHMDRFGYAIVTPRPGEATIDPAPMLDFSSGYVQRATPFLPRQGSAPPWRLYQNYLKDWLMLGVGSVADPALEFRRGG